MTHFIPRDETTNIAIPKIYIFSPWISWYFHQMTDFISWDAPKNIARPKRYSVPPDHLLLPPWLHIWNHAMHQKISKKYYVPPYQFILPPWWNIRYCNAPIDVARRWSGFVPTLSIYVVALMIEGNEERKKWCIDGSIKRLQEKKRHI